MSEDIDTDADATPPYVPPPLPEHLRRVLEGCSREEKKALLDRVLRDLIGDAPEQEYALPNPDGSSYLFLVPPAIHVKYRMTPERIAQLERSRQSTRWTPVGEAIRRLQAMYPPPPEEG